MEDTLRVHDRHMMGVLRRRIRSTRLLRSRSLLCSCPSPRECSSLSDFLSEIASDSCSRKEFSEQLQTIGNIVRRPDWNPNSSITSQRLSFTLSPQHVSELIRTHPDPVWALRIFIWAWRQPGFKPNAILRSEILRLWDENQLIEMFLDVLENVGESNFAMTPERYNLLIKGYGWAEMLDVAIGTLERMQRSGVTPDVSHFNSVLYALVRANRIKNIRQLHEQMLEMGIVPNSVTFALRVRGYCAAGQVDEAFKTFYEMLKKGFEPDLRTFGELVDCMCKSNKIVRQYQLLYEMHANGFTPDESIYHALLEGLCRNCNVKHAERLVKRLQEKGVDKSVTVCNILAKGFCREGKVHNAHEAVNEIIKKGFLPSADVFNLVLILFFKAGKTGQAFRFVDKLMDRGFLPNVSSYNILIYGLSKYGEVLKALEAWNILLQFCLPSVKSYSALLKGLCKAGRLNEAQEVFKLTQEKGGTGDTAAHQMLLYRLRQAGKFQDLKECQDIIDARNCPSDDHSFVFRDLDNNYLSTSQMLGTGTFHDLGNNLEQEIDYSSDDSRSDSSYDEES